MDFIKGITFAPFAGRGILGMEEAKKSLHLLRERTEADFIMLAPSGIQETAQSESICYTSAATSSDREIIDTIELAHSLGLRVGIKPTVNCKNGTWRAHINFFDKDVPCEPKWSNWFAAYTDFQLHYARIAEESGCEMFLAGCEMVMSERREKEWRALISDIRNVYSGLVSYNTDKYQEDNVNWWDCVDMISSSGYYPLHDWEAQLDRIEAVVQKFEKPFFFAECGCMSVAGSSQMPNNWSMKGEADGQEQADWYRAMFEACRKRKWMGGFCLWDWGAKKYAAEDAASNKSYDIYGKPAEAVVREYYGTVF